MFDGHCFDPNDIALLRGVFDAVWSEVEPRTHAGNQTQVCEVIAEGLIALAAAGHRDPGQLRAYAFDRAKTLLRNTVSAQIG